MSESFQLPEVPKPKIKLATVGILPDKIWDADRLDRSRFAKTLREMICEEQEPLVVAVNGKWGSGKTFFSRTIWEGVRIVRNQRCLYLSECMGMRLLI